MKKVGILTLPLIDNYGGMLQTYALYHTIESLGCQPYLLTMPENGFKTMLKKVVTTAMRVVKPNFIRKIDSRLLAGAKMHGFIKRNLPGTLAPRSISSLKAFGLDAIVVGSDQVWRKEYAHGIRRYFLDFAEKWDIRRVAYAASFGISDWAFTPEETADCARLIKKFNAVSVREEDGISLCRENLSIDAVCMPDPTMLLDAADYMATTQTAERQDSGLVSYILDQTDLKADIVEALEKEIGTQNTPLMGDVYEGHDARMVKPLMGIEEWLGKIAGARLVFTDSFHGCVFSIIFNRPFVVVVNKYRGSSRFDTLLSRFGLTGRMATSVDEALRIAREDIDWETVNARRAGLRAEAVAFLREGIGAEN